MRVSMIVGQPPIRPARTSSRSRGCRKSTTVSPRWFWNGMNTSARLTISYCPGLATRSTKFPWSSATAMVPIGAEATARRMLGEVECRHRGEGTSNSLERDLGAQPDNRSERHDISERIEQPRSTCDLRHQKLGPVPVSELANGRTGQNRRQVGRKHVHLPSDQRSWQRPVSQPAPTGDNTPRPPTRLSETNEVRCGRSR